MFRLKIIPYQPNTKSQPLTSTPTPTILYASLNTCTTNSNQHLLASIGRKQSTITFENDKCVSRKHAYLFLHHLDDSNLTQEQTKLCQMDPNGICISLVDNGSKFGSTMLSPSPMRFDHDTDNNNDNNNSDSDTEEEDLTADLHPISPDDNGYYKTQLSPKTPILLSHFSNHHSTNNRPTILQFGISGSQIHLQRLHFSFCFTTFPSSTSLPTQQDLHSIGATSTTRWVLPSNHPSTNHNPQTNNESTHSPPPTTHLIAHQFKTSAKFLTALVSQTPICTRLYLEQLLDRKTLTDPFPSLSDSIPPPPGSNSSSNSTMIQGVYRRLRLCQSSMALDYPMMPHIDTIDITDTSSTGTTTDDSNPLQPYHFLLLSNDELVPLIQLAGASIHQCHEMDDTTFFHTEWWSRPPLDNLSKKGTDKTTNTKPKPTPTPTPKPTVVMESKSRKVRKRMAHLMKMVPSKGWFVTSAKEVAHFVTTTGQKEDDEEQSGGLKDVHGVVIPINDGNDDSLNDDSLNDDGGTIHHKSNDKEMAEDDSSATDDNDDHDVIEEFHEDNAVVDLNTNDHGRNEKEEDLRITTSTKNKNTSTSHDKNSTNIHNDSEIYTNPSNLTKKRPYSNTHNQEEADERDPSTVSSKKRTATTTSTSTSSSSSSVSSNRRSKRPKSNPSNSGWTTSKNTSRQDDEPNTTTTSSQIQSLPRKEALSPIEEQVSTRSSIPPPSPQDDPITTTATTTSSARTTSTSTNTRTRKELPKQNGWFIAAPTNPKLRQEYKRTNEQVSISFKDDRDRYDRSDDEQDDNYKEILIVTNAAETESRSDLILRTTKDKSTPFPSSSSSSLSRRQYHRNHSTSKINYKRFRKNSILSSKSIITTFRSMLPKESERERELQLSQEELEKEQMVAEALFAEGLSGSRSGGSGSRARGGRARAKKTTKKTTNQNSIMQYMSQSPPAIESGGRVGGRRRRVRRD